MRVFITREESGLCVEVTAGEPHPDEHEKRFVEEIKLELDLDLVLSASKVHNVLDAFIGIDEVRSTLEGILTCVLRAGQNLT